jgi:hypothetical protein
MMLLYVGMGKGTERGRGRSGRERTGGRGEVRLLECRHGRIVKGMESGGEEGERAREKGGGVRRGRDRLCAGTGISPL